jgi:fatty acid desaturase
LSTAGAVAAIASEWIVIGATIATAETIRHFVVYAVAVVIVGARQHALTIIVHDAVHFRLFARKAVNDWVADLCAAWPTFLSVEVFRSAHGAHHRHLAGPFDGNRVAWHTHGRDGEIRPEWRYPKSPGGLAVKILRHAAGLTGCRWIWRGLKSPRLARWGKKKTAIFVCYHGAIWIALVSYGYLQLGLLYWILPDCTWHIAAQYLRIICEHSGAIGNGDEPYGKVRSTLPGPLGRFLLLPLNVGYHIEHHWFPSVPWYNLPRLHDALATQPAFVRNAAVERSIAAALGQCVRIQG